MLRVHDHCRSVGNGERHLFDREPVIGHRIECLALISLVCAASEATQRQDEPLVDEGEDDTEAAYRHPLLLLHQHLRCDHEAIIEHFVS